MLIRVAGVLVGVCLFCAPLAIAQTFPEPHDLSDGDYVFTSWSPDSPAGTYPANMRFHRGPGQDPGLGDEPNADYDLAYNLTSGSRINGLGSDGFSFLNIGTAGNLGAAVLALNTTGLANVQVSWLGGTVAGADRPYRIRLQYRVGESGPFTDVPGPVEYTAAATGHSQSFQSVLPTEVDNQPVVYLRWKYYQAGAGSGARPRLRVDNITVVTSDAPGSGTGTATIEPGLIKGGEAQELVLTVTGRSEDPDDTLTHIDFTLPDGWGPVTAQDILLAPDSQATIEVIGQTVRIANVEVTLSQPLAITIANLAVPDASGEFSFGIRTGAGSDDTVAIAGQPTVLVWSTPISLADASANDAQGVSALLGEWVTVQGVITVSNQFQTGSGEAGPSYLEDASGGIAVFSPSGVAANVSLGDEVILLGVVDQFFGLNQLDNSTIVVETVSTGNSVEPTIATLSQIAGDGAGGVEVYEGSLVRINGVTVNTTVWNAPSPGVNYTLTDATGSLAVRINHAVDFAGDPAPQGAFDIIGVVSQFAPQGPPFIGGYQLMPRFAADIIDDSKAPLITSPAPFETSASPGSVTVSWTTDRLAHSEVRYVSSVSGEMGVVIDETPKTEHELTLPDLDAATVYTIEIRTAANKDTTVIANYPVVTTAPDGTTHEIQVYFTGTVDHDLATTTQALSASPVPRIIELIDEADHSIDVALYSLSGTVGASIANALIAAHNRGVAVRVIMDNETSGTAPPGSLQSAGVPFITDSYGPINDGQGLHHNKVAIVDFKGGSPENIWVMMGSWNPTDPGTNQHNQNILFIQDGSVAAAYTREFEQMWGSSTSSPSLTNARFGSNKSVVAPSVLWIGDVYARLIFSPQGFGAFGTTEQHIIRALQSAEFAVDLGLNLITRITIVDALFAMHQDGVAVRGAIGETGTQGSVFNQLSAWADVHAHSSGTYGLLHHKYALVDAEYPWANPITITGSHNWSRSANENNDENTLIIHSADIANQFLQEYVMRYREAGGLAPVGVEEVAGDANVFSVTANFPNPVTATTTFEYSLPAHADVRVRVYNLLGQEVMNVLDESQGAGVYRVTLDTGRLASGVYLYRVEATSGSQRFSETHRMTVVR